MPYSKAYVFAADPNGGNVLCGQAGIQAGVGEFRYSDHWLAQDWAYALDPVNLPLSPKIYRTAHVRATFGVLQDAGPDDWGTRILLMHNRHSPGNELERLLRTSGNGVGCLQFSLSRNRIKQPQVLPDISLLSNLAEVVERVVQKNTLSTEDLALLEPGSSMGGARPKVSVNDAEGAWLVKFSRESDLVDHALLEYCSMRFLKEKLQLNMPELRLIKLGQHSHAFAVKRFDKMRNRPLHFISANSLFNVDKARRIRDSRYNPYSYCNLATILRKHADDFKTECHELFKRMVANILMGNTDDHARNHAMVYDLTSRRWGLSPAYDMLPTVNLSAKQQSMGVGLQGADSTLENALSCSSFFALSPTQAQAIVDECVAYYQTWPAFCAEHGMSDPDKVLAARAQIHYA